MNKKEIYLILEDLRSAENVGAIFRTADAAGAAKIFLVGTTPSPVDRFGREQKKIAKAALGAEKSVAFEYHKDIFSLFSYLREKGITIIAVEQNKDAVDYKDIDAANSTAFVFGNEVNGVSARALQESDAIASIPMLGEKESLNVSVAVGIFLYRVLGI